MKLVDKKKIFLVTKSAVTSAPPCIPLRLNYSPSCTAPLAHVVHWCKL